MSIERRIKDVMQGEPLVEADQSRRLDMLVRQGLMSPAKLPILKRGLAKLNGGKAMAPNERDAVKEILNSFMFIVLGDDSIFNRAKQNTQKNRYQQEEYDADKEHTMDPTSHVKKKDGKFCVYDMKGKKVATFDTKDEADAYAKKNHDDLMNEGVYDMPVKKKKVSDMTPNEKKSNDDRRKAYNEYQKSKRNEEFDPEDETEALTDEDMEELMANIEDQDFVNEEDLSEEDKEHLKKLKKAVNDPKKEPSGYRIKDGKFHPVYRNMKEEQLDEYGAPQSEYARPKEKTPAETKAIKDRMRAKNKLRPKGVQEGVLDRDPESNSFNRTKSKTTKVQTGQKKNPKTGKLEPVYGTSTAPQGLPKMKKEDTGPSPLEMWKEKHLDEGAFKRMATDAEEKKRLGAMAKDKEDHNTGGFRISNKEADAAKKRLEAKKKVAEEAGGALKTGMPKTKSMNKPVGYGIPGSKTPKPKPKKDTLIANPKSGKVRKVTASRGEMAVRKGFVYAEEWTSEEILSLLEMDYKEKFQAMLKKTGKKLSDMSDEDKKKFFNAVDGAHNAKNEDFEVEYLPSFNEYTAEQEELAIEEGAAEDARRDAARDSKGLAPTKKDKPDVKHDAKSDKSVEHIVPQLRKAMSIGKKVTFQDGKSHSISKGHAAKFLNKYMTSKPADKEKMQSHGHTSIDHFKKHV